MELFPRPPLSPSAPQQPLIFMGRLRILTAGIEPAVLEIPADVVTLGRREDNALCVPDASVSGRHCELGESDNSLTILDLGSTNGTFIKGQRIEQGTVMAGETFFLGGVEMRYEVGAPDAGAEPPRATPTPTPTPTAAPTPAPASPGAPALSPSTAPEAEAAEPATVNLPPPAPAPAPTVEKPKGVFPPMPPQPKPGAPLMPKPAMPKPAMPSPAGSGEAAPAVPKLGAAEGPIPAVQKAAAPLAAVSTPAVKPAAAPLAGGMPKVIVPPSEPPKFSLGHHAKPPAAPAPPAKPEPAPSPAAAAAPASAHGNEAAPVASAPAAPKPPQPLGGGGPKVIVPPSEPPKFTLGHHAKTPAAPAASAKAESSSSPAAAPAAAAPAAPKPPQPLGGGGPKVIVPPSEPPKFTLGHHAKAPVAPAPSAKPDSTSSPAAAAAPAAPKPPQPPQPLGGGGPKVIVPPSEPPKFTLGHHAKTPAAPAASAKAESSSSPAAAAPVHASAAAPAAAAPAAPKPPQPLGGGGPKVIVPPSAPPKFSLGHHAKAPVVPPAAAKPAPATVPDSPPPPSPPDASVTEAESPAEAAPAAVAEAPAEPAPGSLIDSATETPTETAIESAVEAGAEPAIEAAAPPPPAPAKNDKRCARHPANVAQHICPKCRAYACDTCGSLSAVGGKPKVFCPVCGAKAQPLAEFEAVQAARRAREDLSFQQQVKGVFKYPFGKGGIALLIIGSLMFFGLDVLVTWGWKFRFIMLKAVSSVGILALFSAGYLCAWLQKILFATAEGEDDVPGWPDFMDWKDDIVMPFRLAIAAAVASFGPAFGYLIFHAVNDSEMRLPVLFPLFALGFIYFPMALLAVAMSNNWLAVNPLVVMPAIARLNLQYVVACLVFFGMVLVRFVSESLLHAVLPIPVLPGLISSFIALYFLCVEMRLLGLLYFTNKKRLGWFSA